MAKKNIVGFPLPFGIASNNKMFRADSYAGPYDSIQDALDTIDPAIREVGREVGIYTDSTKRKVDIYDFQKDENDDWILVIRQSGLSIGKRDLPVDFFIATALQGNYLTYKTDTYKRLNLNDYAAVPIVNSNEIVRNGNDLFITTNFTYDNSENMYLVCLYDCYIDDNNELQVGSSDNLELTITTVHGLHYHREFLYLLTRTNPTTITKINPYNLNDSREVDIEWPGIAGDFVSHKDQMYIPVCSGVGADLAIMKLDMDLEHQESLAVIKTEPDYVTNSNLPIEIYNNEIYVAFYGTGTAFGVKVYDMNGNFLREGIIETEATPQIPYPPLPHWMGFFGGKLLITTVYTSALVRINPYTLDLEETLPLDTSIITDDNSITRDGYVYLNSEASPSIPSATDIFLYKIYYNDFGDLSVELSNYNDGYGSWGSINPDSYKDGADIYVSQTDKDRWNNKLDKLWDDVIEQSTTNLNDYIAVNSGGVLRKTTVAKLLANVPDTNIFLTPPELPLVGEPGRIYIIQKEDPESGNEYNEYVWINDDWELIGTLSINLDDYFTKAEITTFLDSKVDKDGDKQLSDENYTLAEKNKLASIKEIFTTALKNAYDNVVDWVSENGAKVLNHINSPHAPADAQKNSDITKGEIEAKLTGNITSHTHSYDDLTDIPPDFDPTYLENDINNLRDNKVDKEAGKGLSERNYTQAEKDKLAGLESSKFVGQYSSYTALTNAHPTAIVGSYAYVDEGVGVDTVKYIWDSTDEQWILSGNVVDGELTPAQVKSLYESNPDTNAFTDSLKSWLQGMTEQFTTALKNSYDSAVTWISTNGANLIAHLSRTDNPHNVTKGQVGLGNVDNTSDAEKPVSAPQQAALDLKANDADISTVGKSNNYYDLDNIPDPTDLEIGGRNYVLESEEEREIIYYSGNYHLTEPIIAGKQYTVSGMINADSSVNNKFMIYLSGSGISNTFVAESQPAVSVFNEFTLAKITFTAPQTVDGATIARLYFGDNTDTITYKIKNVKLEKSNVATDWTPAPEDKVSDWNETNSNSYSFIKNKPTIPNAPNDGLLTISTSSDLTGAGTFSADQATASNVSIGLSSGTLSDIQLGVTANSLVINGGISRTSQSLNNTNDLDLVVTPGYYHHTSGSAPLNTPTSGAGYLEVVNNGSNSYIRQIWRGRDSRLEYQRTRNSSGVWSDWVVYYNSDNFNPSDYALVSHNHNGIYEPVFSKNTAFNKNFGTSAGTVAEGNDSRLSDAREWTASTVSQSEAETGTSTTRRAWTAQRVRQAITAWWDSIGTTFGKGFISLNNDTEAREKLKLGDSAIKNVGQTKDTVMEGDDDRIVDGGVLRTSQLLTSADHLDTIFDVGIYHTEPNDLVGGFPANEIGGTIEVSKTEDGSLHQFIKTIEREIYYRISYSGTWTGFRQVAFQDWVNNNFAKLSDIYKENAVLDGDWFLKPNTEDTYNTIAREYIINKVLYTDTITGEVTRAPRHATLRRWDMITVESDHTFLITSGVPALDPTRPIPNKQQAVLTYIFVSAIADAPPAPEFLLLYDENVGEPAEANVTTSEPSIVTLDSTEASFQGTKHILFNERVSDTVDEAVVFTFTTLQNLNNYGKLIMHMASGYGGADNSHFHIHVKNGNTTIASFSSNAISWSPTGVDNWERGVLDMVEYANLPHDEFDKIVIDASNGPGWDGYIQEGSKLDYIFLTEKDDTTPVNPVVIQRTSEIPINDGATGVSRYAEMRDIEKPDAILSANSVLNANWNGRDVITAGHSLTVNPTSQDYGNSFEVYLYNNSATDSAIVLNAKTGVTYTVIDNDVSSATVYLQAYGTAVIKRIGNTQNYIIRGYII